MIKGNIIDLPQGSVEWLQFRQNKIGASEIASILGLKGAHTSRKQLLSEKIGVKTKDKPENDFLAKILADGHEWEDVCRQHLNKEFNADFQSVVVQSEIDDRFMASLDGYCNRTNMTLEVKSTIKDEYLKAAEPPTIFTVQMQWQFFCTGLQSGYLAIVDRKLGTIRYFKVTRDDFEITAIKQAVERFLDEIETQSAFEQPQELESDDSILNEISDRKKLSVALKNQLEIVDEEIKEKAELLLKKYNAFKIKGFGVSVERIERVGGVDYTKVPELKNIELNQYRKKTTSFVQVRELK